MESVLVLNADYTVLEVVSWQKAVGLMFREQVRVVENYADRFLRSTSVVLEFPAVVARIKYVRPRKAARLNRKDLFARDMYQCQYCGFQPRKVSGNPDLELLTLDHVIPRSKAVNGWVKVPWHHERVRPTSWWNLLAACGPCNARKADLTLKQAGLVMMKKPRPPTPRELAWMALFKYEVPDEWKLFLPADSPWADYWTVELID
jgi:5-methylcytosine-specific restriction endonuclease McrA